MAIDLYIKAYQLTLINSISKIKIELAGILPAAALPYPSEGGIYNVIFPPELINGKPFCQPTINCPNVNVAVAPTAV